MRRTTGVVAAVLAAVLGAGATTAALRHDRHPVLLPGVTLLTADSGGPPAYTLRDVVTYADHLTVVHVTAEKLKEPPPRSDAAFWSLRTVDLEVGDVLWSRPGARPAPAHLTFDAFGLAYDKHRWTARRAGASGDVRFEVGHSYLMALRWRPARCSAGDPVERAGGR